MMPPIIYSSKRMFDPSRNNVFTQQPTSSNVSVAYANLLLGPGNVQAQICRYTNQAWVLFCRTDADNMSELRQKRDDKSGLQNRHEDSYVLAALVRCRFRQLCLSSILHGFDERCASLLSQLSNIFGNTLPNLKFEFSRLLWISLS